MQTELSLERIKVMRNDLRHDADLEVISFQPNTGIHPGKTGQCAARRGCKRWRRPRRRPWGAWRRNFLTRKKPRFTDAQCQVTTTIQ